MLKSSKTAKITRETARAREALQSGATPESVGMCAYTRGWSDAYTHADDGPRKSGWIARFERGSRDRIAHDTAVALAAGPAYAPAGDVVCHCEVACHHDA